MNENPFANQPSPANDPKKENKEVLAVKVEIATPENWEAYKKLRLKAVTGEDAEMLNSREVKRDRSKGDDEWKKDLEHNEETFFVLAWNGNEAVGMGKAYNLGEGVWNLGAGYVEEELRGKGIGKKVWIARIEEIKKRGGIKVVTGIKYKNEKSLRVAESLGFKKVGLIKRIIRTRSLVIPVIWQGMELDLIPSKNK